MVDQHRRHGIATKPVIYSLPGTESVRIRTDMAYAERDGETLTLDVYSPPDRSTPDTPAVIFVTGFPDDGMRRMVGCNTKDMASYISWARLIAASGLAAVTYTNRSPGRDVRDVLDHVRNHAGALGIDATRIGLWACSAHVPNALGMLMNEPQAIACAALCYGFTIDVDGGHAVADAARTMRFANPAAGRSIEVLPAGVPLFIARAGRDEVAGVNASIDRFVTRALALNHPITLVNHRDAPHAFDIMDDSDMSRDVIRQILAFLRFHLGTPV